MKKFLILLALAVVSILGASSESKAYDRVGYRYKVRYVDFDRGFYRTYNYREDCYADYRWENTRTTCYDVSPWDYVYVQEQSYYDSYGRRYTRVTVYRDQYAYSPIAYYDIYEDATYARTVMSREYYYDYGWYGSHRHYRHTHYHTYYVVELDWDKWETKVFVGAYTSLLGLDLMVNSNSDAGTLVGAALFIVGKAKKAAGYEQRASELQKGIESARKESAGDSFEDNN